MGTMRSLRRQSMYGYQWKRKAAPDLVEDHHVGVLGAVWNVLVNAWHWLFAHKGD